jgi:hypothetical protein
MNRLRPLVAALAATTLGACSDGSPTAPTVASVVVTPGTATLPAPGATVQLSAQVTDVGGAVVTGRPVVWSSADAGVAAVDASGLVTGVTVGSTVITAAVSGVAGSATIDVEQCQQTETVNLSPGVYKAFESTECFIIPSGSNGDRYRVAVVWPAESGEASDVQTVTLRVGGLGVTQAPVAADVVRAPSAAAARTITPRLDLSEFREFVRIAEATRRFHERLRAQEAELVERLPGSSFLRTPRLGEVQRVTRAPSPAKVTFDISTDSECATTAADLKVGILVHENDDLAIYQDSVQRETKPISVGLARDMTDYYTDYGKGVVKDYFGEPSDIDENGKLVVFASPVAADTVAAFVWSGDFFKSEGADGCAASNEMELVYFNTDLILDMEGDDANYQALTTMTHEAKHVVSLYNRIAASIRAGSSQFHPSWIEEGTAEIAGEMSSRAAWAATGGPPVNARITRDDFPRVNGNRFTPENYGFVLHLARTVWYLSSQPNGLVVSPDGADAGHSVYGSGWTFHRWLGDAYGSAANAPYGDAAMFRALNDSLAPGGTAGISQQTGKSFLDLVEEFVVTLSLHETDAPAPALDFATVNYVSTTGIFCNPNPLGVFPWPVTATGTRGDCDAQPRIEEDSNPAATLQTATYTGPIGAAGVRIHEFVSNGTGTGAQFRLEMTPPGKMYVIRLK